MTASARARKTLSFVFMRSPLNFFGNAGCRFFLSETATFSLPAHVDLQLYAVMDNKVCIMVVDTHEKLRGLPILAFRWVVQVWC